MRSYGFEPLSKVVVTAWFPAKFTGPPVTAIVLQVLRPFEVLDIEFKDGI
jgi:hypothetical protein